MSSLYQSEWPDNSNALADFYVRCKYIIRYLSLATGPSYRMWNESFCMVGEKTLRLSPLQNKKIIFHRIISFLYFLPLSLYNNLDIMQFRGLLMAQYSETMSVSRTFYLKISLFFVGLSFLYTKRPYQYGIQAYEGFQM